MLVRIHIFTILFVTLLCAGAVAAQSSDPFFPDRRTEEERKMVNDMLAKQQSEREKREYKSRLERAEKVLAVSTQLERKLTQNEHFTEAEMVSLQDLEKTLLKIREDLGGDDDADDEERADVKATRRPADLLEGVRFLKESSEKLLADIKKTTRFSISVVAIESTNAVLKLVRFLRLRN